MDVQLSQIDGSEVKSDRNSALDALIDFYNAFNRADLVGLKAIWVEGEAPSMDNPVGCIRRGWKSIEDGYSTLFSGVAKVHVAFHDFTSQGGSDWHLFVGRERGKCETPAGSIDLAIRTTRCFVVAAGSWRLLHHHGSIDDPAMLREYQRMVLGETNRTTGS
ncbi:nuclear transport factor 2 family protein [Rhizobium sp. BK376]|uniref:YybH family protein n=1 Tax=Rhizobium sp. BK376 TaxID=2512149 RepID=UPI00104E87ED|nr:nuclear transport factor 2 family protein [Rhizobium sp. BK376]TCR70990.1 SnoaL-like protein [Rhizobium sp. BK376]